ncbi:MAG TPA: glycosyltransferase family 4 protein [Thermoplasmata archaeon]
MHPSSASADRSGSLVMTPTAEDQSLHPSAPRQRQRTILLLNYDDPVNPASGGAPHYCYEVLRRAVDEGYRVIWVSSRFNGSVREETIHGVRIVRFGSPSTVFFYGALYYLLHRKEIDLVFESVSVVPFFSRLYSSKPRLMIIYHIVPREIIREKLGRVGVVPWILQQWISPMTYARERVITLGPSTAEELRSLGYVNVHVVKAGVDLPKGNSPKEDVVVLGGPLRPWKRVEDAVIAFAHLPNNWRLVLFGSFESPEYEVQIRELISRLGIAGRVDVLGRIPDEERARTYSRAKLAICGSKKEGWGLSIFEPQAFGCAAVAYDVPGVRDAVVHGSTGLLVPDGDVAGLTQALLSLAQDEPLRAKLGSQGIERCKQYSWESAYEDFRDQLRSEPVDNE